MAENKRDNQLKNISLVSLVSNSVLAVIKIVVGFISGSYAVIADGIDSSMDVAMSIFMLMTSSIIRKKPNEKYPYGYKKAENITTTIITFIIFIVGFQLLITNIKGLILHLKHDIPAYIAIYATLFSILGKSFLAIWQYKEGKKINSPMVIANAINMRNDIILSTSVLLGLLFTFYFKVPILDRLMAIALSLYIIWVSIKLFKENTVDLMDGVVDCSIYNKVFNAIKDIKGVHNPHRIRIRKLGYMYIIDLDIEVDENMTVKESHNLGTIVEQNIKNEIENVYDVMLHIEPIGNYEKEEKFGVR